MKKRSPISIRSTKRGVRVPPEIRQVLNRTFDEYNILEMTMQAIVHKTAFGSLDGYVFKFRSMYGGPSFDVPAEKLNVSVEAVQRSPRLEPPKGLTGRKTEPVMDTLLSGSSVKTGAAEPE